MNYRYNTYTHMRLIVLVDLSCINLWFIGLTCSTVSKIIFYEPGNYVFRIMVAYVSYIFTYLPAALKQVEL